MQGIVFTELPTSEQAVQKLKIGGINPSGMSCVKIKTSVQVKAWSCNGSSKIDEETVFEVTQDHRPTVYLKNAFSTVRINSGSFEFRNPPHFNSHWEKGNLRDAEYETDAVLDQIFYHPNTAPFLAIKLIQRFGISNPSPSYVKAVAEAFADGNYKENSYIIGTGKYGDLAATAAAILLHPEARAVVLDADPTYGGVREPLLRVMHLMRSLEFQPNTKYFPHVKLILMEEKIGQMAHAIPSVFSFFSSDFVPPGRLNAASLVSPEAAMTNTPLIVGLLNGMFSLIKYKLSSCNFGFGPDSVKCGDNVGELTYQPAVANNIDTAIAELNLLLTAERLSSRDLAVIKDAAMSGVTFQQQLEIAEQLFVVTPEFNTRGAVTRRQLRIEPPLPKPSPRKHKSIVFFFMSGGVDSYSLLVPDRRQCAPLYKMYQDARGTMTMTDDELTPPFSAGGTQPMCDSFTLHKQAADVAELYKNGEAILLANTGVLLEPVTKYDWETKHRATVLFAHDKQQREAKRMDPFREISGTGVLGRMTDCLTRNGYKVGSLSIEAGEEALSGEDFVSPVIKYVNRNGAQKFDPVPSSNKILPAIKKLNNNTAFNSNMFGEIWSASTINALDENDEFVKAFASVNLDNVPKFEGEGKSTSQKLETVAKLIKARNIRGTDRDVFFVELPAWDVHTDAKVRTAEKLTESTAALTGFVKEMKAQGRWEDTVVIMLSEFGRTLSPNSSGGCDHGWGGNYWLAGGSVDGGKILGTYPTNFEELDTSRMRLLPTTPLDAVWNGIAEWFGVLPSDLDKVLPNRRKFPKLFTKADMFKETST